MSIKVLHVIGSLGCGGAQVALKHLIENMDSKEVEAFVYPLRSKEILIPINGNVIKYPYHNYDPRKFFAILRLCKKYNIDILEAHLTKPIMGCLFANFFRKCKVIVHEHGPVFEKGLQYSLYRFVLRVLWRRAAAFVTVSHYMADYLTRRVGITHDRIRVIPNAVDFNIFNPQRIHKGPARQKLGVSEQDIVLGFVGRLNRIKGVDLLVKAMPLLLQQSQRYLLLIAGEGPERKSLEVLAQQVHVDDRVRFLGFCDNVPEIIAVFDIGLMPSRQESFGIACLELMRMKVPVISSGAGGMAEYIIDKQTGLILKENSPEEICRCVQLLSENQQLCSRLVNAAYKLCERFSIEEYVKSHREMYEEVMRQ
jgi:glycosyltransferase involved in cell wall biosynthesis